MWINFLACEKKKKMVVKRTRARTWAVSRQVVYFFPLVLRVPPEVLEFFIFFKKNTILNCARTAAMVKKWFLCHFIWPLFNSQFSRTKYKKLQNLCGDSNAQVLDLVLFTTIFFFFSHARTFMHISLCRMPQQNGRWRSPGAVHSKTLRVLGSTKGNAHLALYKITHIEHKCPLHVWAVGEGVVGFCFTVYSRYFAIIDPPQKSKCWVRDGERVFWCHPKRCCTGIKGRGSKLLLKNEFSASSRHVYL